jgi:hypothetical protein
LLSLYCLILLFHRTLTLVLFSVFFLLSALMLPLTASHFELQSQLLSGFRLVYLVTYLTSPLECLVNVGWNMAELFDFTKVYGTIFHCPKPRDHLLF